MGRRLQAPNELLRRTEVTEVGDLPAYDENLLWVMKRSQECAELARKREQGRQARYYNRRIRNRREFHAGDLVWMHNPPRGKKATKFGHQYLQREGKAGKSGDYHLSSAITTQSRYLIR
ncbi:hypothetical protein PHMEG_00015002 [Phytophthora megakarya]|uniref:Uncharacterized protein n=1 Tax=Phytophthora megakarya TaxID=4795 RepID=A0A225W3F8_9STRA|nr:hypothetical protein PHMEG_00015002 [Phytophthora megakarya]